MENDHALYVYENDVRNESIVPSNFLSPFRVNVELIYYKTAKKNPSKLLTL